MAGAARDPVSKSMDRAARQLLDRVYKARGGWVATRLKDPTPAQAARWLERGINVTGRDPVSGGFNARTRWARALVRALWYQHKWYSGRPGGGWRAEPRNAPRHPGIQVEIGRHRPATGVIPAGRAVRVRAASTAAARRSGKPEDEWSWAGGGRRAEPSDRDWPATGG